jgi:uncharacterized protein
VHGELHGLPGDGVRLSRYNVWVEGPGVPPAVYNGSSGSLVLLEPGEADAVRRFAETGRLGDLDPGRAELLVRSLVLVPDGRDERDVLAARYRKARNDSSVLGLTLVTSLGCNFDCPYCYESKRPSIMAPDVQDAVVRLLDDGAARLRAIDVTWMGGEPLVGKRSLLGLADRLVERCDRHGIGYTSLIVTNGWLLDGDCARELAERRVAAAQVTLDGPPDVHDRMRPYAGGGATFWRIVENLHEAVEHLSVVVRVNVDESNLWRAEELLAILADQGLAGRIGIEAAKMTRYDDNDAAPVATYRARCYGTAEFARVQLDFGELAHRYGFGGPTVPQPTAVPCTAVAANAIVVGSEGEVWKCWDDIGNPARAVGDVRRYRDLDEAGLLPWLAFDPTTDDQCRECIALPSCMGGCLHHTLAGHPRDAQCGTFRFNHREQVRRAVLAATGAPHRSERLLTIEASELAARVEAAMGQAAAWTPVSVRSASGPGPASGPGSGRAP